MARSDEDGTDDAFSTARVLMGLVALVAADRDDRAEGRTPERSEYVLEDAGFSHGDIARLTGKKAEAVRSTLRRRASKGTKT